MCTTVLPSLTFSLGLLPLSYFFQLQIDQCALHVTHAEEIKQKVIVILFAIIQKESLAMLTQPPFINLNLVSPCSCTLERKLLFILKCGGKTLTFYTFF